MAGCLLCFRVNLLLLDYWLSCALPRGVIASIKMQIARDLIHRSIFIAMDKESETF